MQATSERIITMTDKDTMGGLDTFAVGYAAAKQEDRKELEAANKDRLEMHRNLSAETTAKFEVLKALETANQRIA